MKLAIIASILGVLMLLGAYGHFFNSGFYEPLIPDFISKSLANISSGLLELVLGIGLLIPATRSWAGLGFMILMIAFTPLHIWDLVKENPMMGSKMGALIRLLIHFLLIYAGWWIFSNK